MSILYLVAFILGLLLAVRSMLLGVEKRQAVFGSGVAAEVSTSPAVLAAFAMTFGVVGYLFARPERLGTLWGGAAAISSALLASLLSARLVRRAEAFLPEHDPDDPRYVLQGHVAKVTAPIAGAAAGEISFAVEGREYVVKAVSIDGSAAAIGDEVVIERIDDGVAHVELWASIEERL
jgi:membrane protein implicated in regulation of membrane protease activity